MAGERCDKPLLQLYIIRYSWDPLSSDATGNAARGGE